LILRRFFALSILTVFSILNLFAAELTEGNIRLTINEKRGSFSLFYLSDPAAMRYEPLFNSREPSASYLSLNVDGRIHRLGKSRAFNTRVERQNGNPAIVFESSFLTVSEVFSPVRTAGSQEVNGVKITITIQNTGNRALPVGLRMLLDTHLGEGRGREHFYTNRRSISRETVIQSTSDELLWVSHNQDLSLAGSIANPLDRTSMAPDFIHIANWRRLNKTPWHLRPSEGRSFNYFPYFTRDSAVCYYYEPRILEIGSSFTYSIILVANDISWYGTAGVTEVSSQHIASLIESVSDDVDANLLLMYRLQEILNQFIAGEITLVEQEIEEIERTIERLRAGIY
jgi:hypothetical protein